MSRALWAVLALLCAPAAPSSAELTVNPPYADVRGGQPLVLTLATGTHWQLEQPHCLIGTPAALMCAVPLPCRRTGSALPPAHCTHLWHRAACTGGHHCATSSRADSSLPCGTRGGRMGRRPPAVPTLVVPMGRETLLWCPHLPPVRRGERRTPPVTCHHAREHATPCEHHRRSEGGGCAPCERHAALVHGSAGAAPQARRRRHLDGCDNLC